MRLWRTVTCLYRCTSPAWSPEKNLEAPSHARRFLVLITLWDLRRGPCSQKSTWVPLGQQDLQRSFRGIGKPRSPTLVLIAFQESLRLFQKRINSRVQEMRTEPTCFWLKKFWEPLAFVRTKQSLGDRKDWDFRRCIDGFNPALLRGTSLCS